MAALAADLSIAVLTHENTGSTVGAFSTLPDELAVLYRVF